MELDEIDQSRNTQKQFVRYFIVSLMSLVLNGIIFAVLYQSFLLVTESLSLGFLNPYFLLLAQFIAILIVTIFNFGLNRFWSFEIREAERAGRHFIKYGIVGAIGTFVNLGVLAFLNSILQLPYLVPSPFGPLRNPLLFDIYDLVHLMTAVTCSSVAYLVAMVHNFLLNKWWTFEQPPQAFISFKRTLNEKIRSYNDQ